MIISNQPQSNRLKREGRMFNFAHAAEVKKVILVARELSRLLR